MKNFAFLNLPPLFVEISQSSLKAVHENQGVELPLEREPGGGLTAPCKESIISALKDFLKPKSWQPRALAYCAVGSRGVSLRRLSLPAGTKEEFYRRLLLQIEAEFPLPPEALAWGCQMLGGPPPPNGTVAKHELLVAAAKKDWVADYHDILRACGTEPVFTLAVLARRKLCAHPSGSFTLLHIENSQSELTGFENGVPANSRIVFWGTDNRPETPDAKFDALVQAIKGSGSGAKLFVSGNQASEDCVTRLATSLGSRWQCERLAAAGGVGRSAAISGLQKIVEQEGELSLPICVKHSSGAAMSLATPDLKKWGARAGALLAAVLLLPYAEALLLKPHLAHKVALFKAESARLTAIDNELDFLRYLKQSQPPYLDALYILSKSVPQGTRFDTLSLNSHGEVTLRAAFRDGQQVADFRSKLIDSGFFANVTVEDQSPTPDHQRVNVHISAQEKPAAQLPVVAIDAGTESAAKGGKTSPPGGGPPMVKSVATNAMPAAKKETK